MWGWPLHSDIPGYSRAISAPICITLLTLAWAGVSFAQISPGELSKAHANLEGLSHCTSCHTLGKAVSNEKCLSCHAPIETRIKAGTGLHARYTGKECVECHKEHHGRDFTVVRFDRKTFNHSQTGYVLEGKHGTLACEQCHTRKNIKAPDVLANVALLASSTFLGMQRECLSCHVDNHKGQLSHDCVQCHSMTGWRPASKFNHDRARYQLTGKHTNVQCSKCHQPMGGPPSPIQYTKIEFSSCSSCHGDPHSGKFKNPCESCHTTLGWREGKARNFDHAQTRFPLKGKHADVKCEQCHGGTQVLPVKGALTKDRFHISKSSLCDDCHKDPHLGQFTQKATPTCASCHVETGWKDGKARSFDHSTTKFPLKGKHASVSCARCHGKEDSIKPAESTGRVDFRNFSHCADCHKEYHHNQFANRSDRGTCEACHTETGFSPSTFSPELHAKTHFPLTGAHIAIPCSKCHTRKVAADPTSVIYARTGEIRCFDCHTDQHRDEFALIKTTYCESCHTADAWKKMIFDHDTTKYKLTGKHSGVACAGCHKPGGASGTSRRWKFRNIPSRCIDCHPASITPDEL